MAFRIALVDAARRRHVVIVATDSDADISLAGHAVVGRIEADPAQRGQEDLDPGVGSVRVGAVALVAVGEQISGHVARRDAPAAQDGDHDVGKVLADPAPQLQSLVNVALGRGGAGLVVEAVVDRF
jgi:hypothetical protein